MPQHEPAMHEMEKKIRKFARRVVIILAAGFVIVFCMKSIHAHRLKNAADEAASAPPLVKVITVSKVPASAYLVLPGATAAWYESTIYARVDGYVGNWTADIGDSVKKGQVLATLETPDLDAQLAAAKAKLQADEALVKARQADADFAKTTYERWRDSPKGVVSEQEREAKKAGYESAVAQLNQAKAQAGLDKADVDRYTILAGFKQVVAPYDGKITERRVDIGNLVTAGSSANTTLLYRMAQSDPMRIFVDAPQRIAEDMKPGVTARISASATGERLFEGKIARTADAIDPQARTLKVEVDMPNPDRVLVPGMYVDVRFDLPSKGQAEVPAAVLLFRSQGPEVAVVKEGIVHFRKVAIVRDNGNTVEIGSGIAVGDQVALNISNQITEGEKVEVSEDNEPHDK